MTKASDVVKKVNQLRRSNSQFELLCQELSSEAAELDSIEHTAKIEYFLTSYWNGDDDISCSDPDVLKDDLVEQFEKVIEKAIKNHRAQIKKFYKKVAAAAKKYGFDPQDFEEYFFL